MSNGLHEKLQLSGADIKYLQKVFLDNAHEKLRLNLPSSSQDTKDPLTRKIVDMTEDFIYEIFEMARHSLVIDGQDMSGVESLKNVLEEPKEQMEPFDVELNARLRALYQEVEKETLEVTSLRRTLPTQAQDSYNELWHTQHEQKLDELMHEDFSHDGDVDTIADAAGVPNLQSMIDDYDETLKILNELRHAIPSQTSEAEKLVEISEFIHKMGQ